MKVKTTNTVNTSEKPPIRKLINRPRKWKSKLHWLKFNNCFTDSESILNGNNPPIASQKAFNIIADSLRRIDVSLVPHFHRNFVTFLFDWDELLYNSFLMIPAVLNALSVFFSRLLCARNICVVLFWQNKKQNHILFWRCKCNWFPFVPIHFQSRKFCHSHRV